MTIRVNTLFSAKFENLIVNVNNSKHYIKFKNLSFFKSNVHKITELNMLHIFNSVIFCSTVGSFTAIFQQFHPTIVSSTIYTSRIMSCKLVYWSSFERLWASLVIIDPYQHRYDMTSSNNKSWSQFIRFSKR